MWIERRKSGIHRIREKVDGKSTTVFTGDEDACQQFLAGNRPLRSETDPYRDDYNLPGSTSWGKEADAQKKQEYNRTMGEVADFMADPTGVDEAGLERIARYLSNLAEDEQRFVNRRRARHVSLAAAREVLFVRRFMEAARVVFKDKVSASGYATQPPSKKHPRRKVNLMLSDLHFGARLDGAELPVEFNARTEARRLAKVIMETIAYKPHYREQTELNLLVNGDIIEGLLQHDEADGDPLTDQFVAITYALVQAITLLATHYPSVNVYWQTGNHGRNKLRHPGRATTSKWDSFETMIGKSVELACSSLRNVRWEIPRAPYCAVPLFESHMLLTHGDTVINVGNPGATLPINKIEQQMSKINATRVYGHQFDVFAVGHVHLGVNVLLPSGHLIINPPLVPSNGFALSLGYVSACGQYLWESIEGYPVGDTRLIRVGKSEDEDPKLERIIKPARFSYDPVERFPK